MPNRHYMINTLYESNTDEDSWTILENLSLMIQKLHEALKNLLQDWSY